MATPAPTVQVGDPVDHVQLDGLLKAADERLGLLFGGNRSPWIYNNQQPAWQIFPLGAVYVMSRDADRHYQGVSGQFPSQYNHTSVKNAVNAATITGLSSDKKSLVISGYNHPYYSSGDSLEILYRTWDDPDDDPDMGPVTLPIRQEGSEEPERFHPYAMADIIADGVSDPLTWDPLWNKHGILRFHNLSKTSWAVDLGHGQQLAIPKYECRCIRRTVPNGGWIQGRFYFPPAVSLDAPCWFWVDNVGQQPMAPRALQSYKCNPIINLALLASIFRATQLTGTPIGQTVLPPGMFHGPPADGALGNPASLLIDTIAHGGDFQIFRTTIDGETEPPTTLSLATASHLDGFAPLLNLGIKTSYEDSTHGLRLEWDGNTKPPDPPAGDYAYDLLAYSTSVFGCVCRPIENDSLNIHHLMARGPFGMNGNPDGWYNQLFGWPNVPLIIQFAGYQTEFIGTWIPTDDGAFYPSVNLDKNVWGAWQYETENRIHGFVGQWNITGYGSIPTWNLFTSTLSDGLALIPSSYGDTNSFNRQNKQAHFGPLRTTISLTETSSFWHAEDAAGPACPIDLYPGETVESSGSGTIGLGVATEGINGPGWQEPRWQESFIPTIGENPAVPIPSDALAHGKGEPWAYSQVKFALSPNGLPDYTRPINPRMTLAQGGSSGAPWVFDSTAIIAASPFGFARVWWWSEAPPSGPDDYYHPETIAGVPVFKARDHGARIADWLKSGTPWGTIRSHVYDRVPLDQGERGACVNVRMHASTFNALADLINRVKLIRPMQFEHWLDGFPLTDLDGLGGWRVDGCVTSPAIETTDYPTAQPFGIQPLGYIGAVGNSNTDAKLAALGMPKRTADAPAELFALRTIPLKYFKILQGEYIRPYPPYGNEGPPPGLGVFVVDLTESDRPHNWTGFAPLTYYHFDDLKLTLDATGFPWHWFSASFPCRLVSYVPDVSAASLIWRQFESSTVQPVPYPPPTRPIPEAGAYWRWRIAATTVAPLLDEAGTFQLERGRYDFAYLVLSEGYVPMSQSGFQVMGDIYIDNYATPEPIWNGTTYSIWRFSFPPDVAAATSWYGYRFAGRGVWEGSGTYDQYSVPLMKILTNEDWATVLAVPHATPYSDHGDRGSSSPDVQSLYPFGNEAIEPEKTDLPRWMQVRHGDVLSPQTLLGKTMVSWRIRWLPPGSIKL